MDDNQYKLTLEVTKYGLEAINLCIERHHLANEKRTVWGTQYYLYKTDQEANSNEFKEEIDNLHKKVAEVTRKIEEVDAKLSMYGINEKERKKIIRLAKAAFPDEWMVGFTEM